MRALAWAATGIITAGTLWAAGMVLYGIGRTVIEQMAQRAMTPMARLRGALPAEESDAEFDAAIAKIRKDES